jgi:ketosteroid isomerase-like protein
MRVFILFAFSTLFLACETSSPKVDKEAIKKEIVEVEAQFARFLKDSGAAAAFYKYAAPDAVIKRGSENDTLIKGREAIRNSYSSVFYERAIAEWAPDYVDISEDGTMAYTYGKYSWKFYSPEDGRESIYKGVFHTVWKKMDDDSWKYVWD